jgi:hypothetical protein
MLVDRTLALVCQLASEVLACATVLAVLAPLLLRWLS